MDADKAEKAYRESVERLNTASARWEELNVRLCREIQRFEEERIAVTKKSLRNSLEHQIQICAQTTNKVILSKGYPILTPSSNLDGL